MDAVAFHQNLYRHHDLYYFRRAIPKHLMIYFGRRKNKKNLSKQATSKMPVISGTF